MSERTYSAGLVTAYGAAVRGGYRGTYAEFCRQQAEYADNAAAVEQAKTDVQSAATSAAGSATSAGASATAAAGSATSAGASATAAAGSATTAGQHKDAAATSATNAASSATAAAASATSAATSASAAQAVLESIPEDYSDLSKDVDDLKADLGNKTDHAFAYCESGRFVIFSDYDESPVKFDVRTYNFYVSINKKKYTITPQNILDAATAAGLTIEGTVISGTTWALYLDMSESTPTVKALIGATSNTSVAILSKNVVLFAGHYKSFRYGLFVDYMTQRKAENGRNASITNAENIATNTADIATNAENEYGRG